MNDSTPDGLKTWALLVLSLIPLQLLGHWLDSTFALETVRILKQRLLAGALGMDLESVQASGSRTVAGALGGLIGLTPAFVSGNASQLELAIGVLLDASDLIRCCAGSI